jgi:hypothetical protein
MVDFSRTPRVDKRQRLAALTLLIASVLGAAACGGGSAAADGAGTTPSGTGTGGVAPAPAPPATPPPAPPPAPPPPAPPPPSSYDACQSTAGARRVADFGAWAPNASDATSRERNTATLNKALDEVGKQPGGGTVCLPPGSYFLGNRAGGREAALIARSNVTLWGAGMEAANGGTRLVSRSEWNLDAAGQVLRGNGLRLQGSADALAPLRNITLRDFELDGGAGYTGNFGFPADPRTGDGWDLTHKGIVLASDDCVDQVRLERVWVHAFRGEVIYAGGQCLQTVSVDAIRSEDTNASTFNITANASVRNSSFGRSSIWMELGAGGPYNSTTWTNNSFKDAARFGINIAQGDLRANTPHRFEGNRFENCGGTAFYFGGGAGGPITIAGNQFVRCSGVTTGRADNAAPFARYENQLLTFENNTLTDVATMVDLGAILNDAMFRGNTITNTTGVTGATTATTICASTLRNVIIENNLFENTRTPEESCALAGGERPLYRGNRYLASESRDGQGSTFITASQRLIRPLFENAYVVVDAANVIAQMAVNGYPNGQTVTITGGTPDRALRFATGQSSYVVAQERTLSGAPSKISLQFDKAAGRWLELVP